MDTTYVQRLVIDNEIGLALTYLGTQGRDVTLLMSNYNQHNDQYMRGITSYDEFSRQTALIKSHIIAMLNNQAFHIPMAAPEDVKTAVIIIASKKDMAQAIAVRSIFEDSGLVATITDALDIKIETIVDFNLVYLISKNYFDIGTKWPVSTTSSICAVVSLLIDEALDKEDYLAEVNQLNNTAHDLQDAIKDGISRGFPVGALANSLAHVEQAKLNLDRDYNYLWSNPPNDCRGLFFEIGVSAAIKKFKK